MGTGFGGTDLSVGVVQILLKPFGFVCLKLKKNLVKMNNLNHILKFDQMVKWCRLWCKLTIGLVQNLLKSFGRILALQ